MSLAVTALRRSLWLLLIGAVGSVAWSWWSDRNAPPSPKAPPEWPPLDVQTAVESLPTSATTPTPTQTSTPADDGWIAPDNGACPISHPIKANDNSRIFHVPGGRFYDRTNAERCYADPDAAVADGYRQAKN